MTVSSDMFLDNSSTIIRHYMLLSVVKATSTWGSNPNVRWRSVKSQRISFWNNLKRGSELNNSWRETESNANASETNNETRSVYFGVFFEFLIVVIVNVANDISVRTSQDFLNTKRNIKTMENTYLHDSASSNLKKCARTSFTIIRGEQLEELQCQRETVAEHVERCSGNINKRRCWHIPHILGQRILGTFDTRQPTVWWNCCCLGFR